MSRWWRAYAEARNDPKIQGLPLDMFRAWFNLCCLAAERGGYIPSILDAAMAMHMSESKAEATIVFLAGKKLLDAVSGGYFEPHNWKQRQYKSDVSTDRVQQFRKRRRNGGETFRETEVKRPQIQSTESEAERKKETRASALATFGWPVDFREQFWSAYPNKIGKADAIRKLERVAKSNCISFDAMMTALFRYANKTDDRAFCNPATWLHQERWTDQPADNNGHKNGTNSTNCDLLKAADDLVARTHARLAEVRGESGVFERESPPAAWTVPKG